MQWKWKRNEYGPFISRRAAVRPVAGEKSRIFLRDFSEIGSGEDYAGRIRQKSARAEGAKDRDRSAQRAAPKGRGRLSNDARKPDFIGFACGRTVRAFETRTKAPTSCLRIFEPSA